jgi:hypothetical protein
MQEIARPIADIGTNTIRAGCGRVLKKLIIKLLIKSGKKKTPRYTLRSNPIKQQHKHKQKR